MYPTSAQPPNGVKQNIANTTALAVGRGRTRAPNVTAETIPSRVIA